MKNLFKGLLVFVLSFALAGCTFIIQKGRRSDALKIEELSNQLDELAQAKRLLEERLGKEISDKQIKLQMMEKGLVITVVGDLLFDSGKAQIRQEAYPLLDKVSRILKDNMGGFNIGIEGYTDNVAIKHSSWKSNWELSTARSLSVLHFLVNEKGISPERLSAIGFGEYRPVATNDTREGRKLNRRVEIVIQPKVSKVKDGGSLGENLK
ncbi:MAG: OmpA family protein [Candidatus Omnitrophica bacterium]|jgi:chemotaxis protein MotB|nr:OmpA family protein [Candidatus Omnitrophota bacterium]MDD3987732.1 OmpA family protein [Candidatus Omnitrophota bacterium]MDD4981272.1 OmpA family protein [Candidatus Omnitrophota bacterium]MDD5664686.1 OmpA family protein [Candidatus Omnitrophota bacterium]